MTIFKVYSVRGESEQGFGFGVLYFSQNDAKWMTTNTRHDSHTNTKYEGLSLMRLLITQGNTVHTKVYIHFTEETISMHS